uniref:Uncharacterized protein n=1 Tax=viral metagenome TaxID=1070528 RepID=A0A6C0ADK7_9ZZZZ
MTTPIKIYSSTPVFSSQGSIITIIGTGIYENRNNLVIELTPNQQFNGKSFSKFYLITDTNGNDELIVDVSGILNDPTQPVFNGTVFKINLHNINSDPINYSYSPNTYTIDNNLRATSSSRANTDKVYEDW